jgi:hypothetical protein
VPTGGELVFKGTTNQGREIELHVKPDRSAVDYIKLNYRVECPGVTVTGTSTVTSIGWSIDGGNFDMEAECSFEVTGSFDAGFNSVSGTWQGIVCESGGWPRTEICRGPVGTWNATRQ